jgi:hypothetical protein
VRERYQCRLTPAPGPSLGLCRPHAAERLRLEQEDGFTLGNSIIYESLIGVALAGTQATRRAVQGEIRRNQRRTFASGLLHPAPQPAARGSALQSKGTCPACQLGAATARHYGDVLVEMLAAAPFRASYEQSDGVCLPHLRGILAHADPVPGLDHLLAAAEAHLAALEADLAEFGRKHSFQFHHEGITDAEARSVERAIAFLCGGGAPPPHGWPPPGAGLAKERVARRGTTSSG